MSSDDDYASFLDKANQETGVSGTRIASGNSNSAIGKGSDMDLPKGLQEVQQYYESEADEPFEPVSFKWDGKSLPSKG